MFSEIEPAITYQFTIGSQATHAAHRLIYNDVTGELFYDADGAGGVAQVKFADIGKALALNGSHFELF